MVDLPSVIRQRQNKAVAQPLSPIGMFQLAVTSDGKPRVTGLGATRENQISHGAMTDLPHTTTQIVATHAARSARAKQPKPVAAIAIFDIHNIEPGQQRCKILWIKIRAGRAGTPPPTPVPCPQEPVGPHVTEATGLVVKIVFSRQGPDIDDQERSRNPVVLGNGNVFPWLEDVVL